MTESGGAAASSAVADRLTALQARIGLGITDAATSDALRGLLTDIAAAQGTSPASAPDLQWWAAATRDALALTLVHRGDASGAAREYRQAAAVWTQLGEDARGGESAAAAVTQAVAAGGALDGVITDLVADLGAAQGLPRAALLVRLARLAADVGDHFEARRRAEEAAQLLVGLGYLDPSSDPAGAFATWLPPSADARDVATLRKVTTVLTTWGALLGVRGAIGDGWATAALQALPELSRRLMAQAGMPADETAQRVLRLSARLDQLQDAYDNSPDTPDPATWQRLYDATRAVVTEAAELDQPTVAAMAHILESDLLTWAGRPADASTVLATARVELRAAQSAPEAIRSALVVQLIRRQVEIAAATPDSAAVSRFAGEGIDAIEADRRRLNLPYLQDSYLRDRRLIYVAGMAAARRLDDLDLLLERADLVKARGSVAWLREAPAPIGAIRASLGPDEVVVYHLWADRTVLYVLSVDRDEIVCDRKLLTEGQRAELDSLVADFAGLRSEATWPDRAIPPLGDLLLPTDGARLLSGKTRLIVSPNGLLHQVPMHALRWQGGPLVESFAISYVPNFAALTRRPARPAAGSALVVGIGAFPNARTLRTAEQEATAVAARYPQADLLLGPQADRAALAARVADGRLGGVPMIHLATHGQDGPLDDPLAARFLLADGDVEGTAMAGWQLAADLVVLSACWSAQRAVLGRDGSELFGDEVYGLQSAFFAAGARQVLGAMWPARDAVTTALMTRFHGLLTTGTPADVALQTAMIEAWRADGLLYHWAPYKLTFLGRPPQNMENS